MTCCIFRTGAVAVAAMVGAWSMVQETKTGQRWLIWTLLGLMAGISLALAGAGGTLWVDAVGTWSDHDYLFSGWQMLDWFFGLIGAAMVGIGLLVAGLVLRFVPWARASLASLVLSIVALVFNLGTYGIFSRIQSGLHSLDLLILQSGCVLGLFIVVLPPFLHWLHAKPAGSAAMPPRAADTSPTRTP